MTHPLAVFNYEGTQVRTIERDGEPWFIAKDVADVLGISKARDFVANHIEDDERASTEMDTPGGKQTMTIVNESGLYTMILKSNKPASRKFRVWVTSEVLPSIRKTGHYSMQPQELIARAVIEAQKLIDHQTVMIAEMKPKADFFDTVTGSGDAVDIGTVAKVLNMGVGRTRLFEILRNEKILQPNNQPYQKYIDCGYFRVIESSYNKPDGSSHINFKTVVYQKGIDFIRRRLMDMKEAA